MFDRWIRNNGLWLPRAHWMGSDYAPSMGWCECDYWTAGCTVFENEFTDIYDHTTSVFFSLNTLDVDVTLSDLDDDTCSCADMDGIYEAIDSDSAGTGSDAYSVEVCHVTVSETFSGTPNVDIQVKFACSLELKKRALFVEIGNDNYCYPNCPPFYYPSAMFYKPASADPSDGSTWSDASGPWPASGSIEIPIISALGCGCDMSIGSALVEWTNTPNY